MTYTPKLDENKKPTSFVVTKNGKEILNYKVESEPMQLWLVSPIINVAKPSSAFMRNRLIADICGMKPARCATPFFDLTGDAMPDVIVAEYSGGAHCCYGYTIYSLGEKSKKYDELTGQHTQFVFADVDHDGKYEAIGMDWTFAYWNAGFAQSPAQVVILKPGIDGYKMAPQLMKTLPPSEKQIQEIVDECTTVIGEGANAINNIPVEVWSNMLDLIYCGHSAKAWVLLDRVWPKAAKATVGVDGEKPITKAEFIAMLMDQLEGSPYWDGVRELNKQDPRFKPSKLLKKPGGRSQR